MIDIYLDNNVFDYLYENNIDILKEFPNNKFSLKITKEISFEVEAITNLDKQNFIKNLSYIEICPIFGFNDNNHSFNKQRNGDFDIGGFSSVKQYKYKEELKNKFLKLKKNPKHDLYKEEADIDLAVRSVEYIVLTLDEKRKKKKGPLNDAHEKGYNVVFLTDFDLKKESLNNFVKIYLHSRGLKSWN